MMCTLITIAVVASVLLWTGVWDEPIRRSEGDNRGGPTGNWYIVHVQRGGEHTHLSGHWTRAGAEREVALCKQAMPWLAKDKWLVRRASEYKELSRAKETL